MKILILNGSPKGDKSISLFYAKYLVNQFSEIDFKILQVSSQIRALEKDNDKFNALISEINSADGIIWTFPVYVLSIPGQMIRFFELMRKRCSPDILKGKYVTSVCSSMHFFDHNAMLHLQVEIESFKGYFIDGFSAEMFDIKKPIVRKNIEIFAKNFFSYISEKKIASRRFFFSSTKERKNNTYIANLNKVTELNHSAKIVLVSNASEDDNNLNQMIQFFLKKMGKQVKQIPISEIDLKGGCLGCLRCSQEGKCVYKDEYEKYKPLLKDADAIIYALSMKDYSFGSKFKFFADRNFSNGHRIKDNFFTGFLISGKLSKSYITQNIIDGINYGGKSSFEGNVISDEYDSSEEISKLIDVLCVNLINNIDNKYQKPPNFYGIAAHKIFRDLVFSSSSFQRADDKHYKKHGLYDFPTRDYKTRFRNLLFKIITSHKGVRKSFNKKINQLMLEEMKKAIKDK